MCKSDATQSGSQIVGQSHVDIIDVTTINLQSSNYNRQTVEHMTMIQNMIPMRRITILGTK